MYKIGEEIPIKVTKIKIIDIGKPVKKIGKNPDMNTINEVPKSGCLNIKKEHRLTAAIEIIQSENDGFNSFLVKKDAIDNGRINLTISEG